MDNDNFKVAIVGMACRVPGARTPRAFWNNLISKTSHIRRFSTNELQEAGIPQQLIGDPNYVPAHGFLDDFDAFDSEFFGVSTREAELIDPQHRILMETALAALQDAGLENKARREGLTCGVFVGTTISTYFAHNILQRDDLRSLFGDQQIMLACDKDYAALRIAHALDFRGPAMSVQAACASSLVAVSSAVSSLLAGECDIAVAGGSSIRSPQKAGYLYAEGGTGSPDGRCLAFDKNANGSVAGSGAGAVILQRLPDSIENRSRIHAVISGSCVTNDGGQKPNFVAPTVRGQLDAMQRSLDLAGVNPNQVDVIEAHGTGTKIGDPIEAEALRQAYCGDATAEPVFLGTVKPNIGHLDAAAGIVGLIRVALSLRFRTAPPIFGFSTPNPECKFEDSRIKIPAGATRLAENKKTLFGAVNSIGMGGVNAHVLLESAPISDRASQEMPSVAIPMSANSICALERFKQDVADVLADVEYLPDAQFSLQAGRACRKYRTIAYGSDANNLRQSISKAKAENAEDSRGPVVFLFPGQGQLGIEEMRSASTEFVDFSKELSVLLEALSKEFDEDLRWLATAENPPATAGKYFGQIAAFAGSLAAARMLEGKGLAPNMVAGYSMGEIAAACVSGILSLEQACKLLKARIDSFSKAKAGAMLLATSDVDVNRFEDLWPAIELTKNRSVYGGSKSAIKALEKELLDAKRSSINIDVEHAFHTPFMERSALKITEALEKTFKACEPSIPFLSGFAFDERTGPGELAYWVNQICRKMRFDSVMDQLESLENPLIVDLSSKQSMATMMDIKVRHSARAPSLNASWPAQIVSHIGTAWSLGHDVSWPQYEGAESAQICDLPTYAFERNRYWIKPNAARQEKISGQNKSEQEQLPPQMNIGAMSAQVRIYSDHIEISTRPENAQISDSAAENSGSAETTSPEPADSAAAEKQAPSNDPKSILRSTVAELLGHEVFGDDNDLIELGLNSLTMTRLVAQIRERLSADMSLSDVFETPTINGCLRLLQGSPQPNIQSLALSEFDFVEQLPNDLEGPEEHNG